MHGLAIGSSAIAIKFNYFAYFLDHVLDFVLRILVTVQKTCSRFFKIVLLSIELRYKGSWMLKHSEKY